MKLCVLGAGSWGIALALHLKRTGHLINLWEHEPSKAENLRQTRENKTLLPGILLPSDIAITSKIEEALEGREGVVLVVPSHVVRPTIQKAALAWPKAAW